MRGLAIKGIPPRAWLFVPEKHRAPLAVPVPTAPTALNLPETSKDRDSNLKTTADEHAFD